MIGNKVLLLEQVDSTNLFAASLLESANLPGEGTVIMAHFQEKGKGQRESVWESEKNQNLLCSIILYPYFLPISMQFILNQAVSLAVAEFIEEVTGLKVTIKWPNDILVNEKKMAGILIENNLKGNIYYSAIIGLGLNINQLVFRNSGYAASSLASLTGKSYDLSACSQLIFNKLDFYYNALRKKETEQISEKYLQRLFRLDIPAMYEFNGKPVKAIIRGVKPEGDLVLEFDAGEIRYIHTREIKYLF